MVSELQDEVRLEMDENIKLQGANNLLEEETRKLGEAKNQIMEEKCSLESELRGSARIRTANQAENLWLNQRVDELEQEILEVQEKSEKETKQLRKAVKDLQKKLTDQEKALEEQQSMVECPVCLMLPREGPAVPCCPQGHFICSQCLDKRKAQDKQDCPTCRGPMGEGRSLLAFTVVKQAKHECTLEGCSTVVPFDEIKQHEERCNWRLVICPGSTRSCNVMVPFQKVEEHLKDCSGFVVPPGWDEGTGVSCKRSMAKTKFEDQESVYWRTQVVKYADEIF